MAADRRFLREYHPVPDYRYGIAATAKESARFQPFFGFVIFARTHFFRMAGFAVAPVAAIKGEHAKDVRYCPKKVQNNCKLMKIQECWRWGSNLPGRREICKLQIPNRYSSQDSHGCHGCLAH